jgi:hypothetical protein
MLELMWNAFCAAGEWPTFQYVSANIWPELEVEPRDIYYELSDADFVLPRVVAQRSFELREETRVGISLSGLVHLRAASADLGRFVSAVRYIGARAARFHPSTSTAPEELRVTSEEVRFGLPLKPTEAEVLRLAALLKEHAWRIWTAFAGPDAGGQWSLSVSVEQARSYRNVQTLIDFFEIQAETRRQESAVFELPADGEPEITEDAVRQPSTLLGEDERRVTADTPQQLNTPLDTRRTGEPPRFSAGAHSEGGVGRVVIARRLEAELEEAEDLIGAALNEARLWRAPRRCPDGVWKEYDVVLAAASPGTHKAVQDAYRKLKDVNLRVRERAADEEPGAILADGQGLRLDEREAGRLREVLAVIRNAKDHLALFADLVPEAAEAKAGTNWPNEYWRSQMTYVFDVPEPGSFPPLEKPLASADERVLRRYIDVARELSQSHVLNDETIGFKLSFLHSSVETTMPSGELLRGLSLGFRQLYSPEERGSFSDAMRVLQLAARDSQTEATEVQLEQLARWGKIAGKLRSDWLPTLVYEHATGQGESASEPYPPPPEQTPEQLLKAFFYGDYIHWDRSSEQIETWSNDPLDNAVYRLFFLRAISQLAAVYVPFADVVAAALGEIEESV